MFLLRYCFFECRPHRNLHAATCSTGSNPFLKHALVGNLVSVAVYGDRDKPDFVAYLDLNISPGMKLLGVISEGNDKDLVVTLPGAWFTRTSSGK
ncbi:hypothetical protein KSS87_003846 [Heliosperma pusillum]|nr:hypothetical protein KSS87_003846 [Heliosperma pusillum]